jgi:predicted DNA-binding protein
MDKETKRLNINLPASEMEILDAYCQQTNRNKTDVLREYIRSLAKKISKSK